MVLLLSCESSLYVSDTLYQICNFLLGCNLSLYSLMPCGEQRFLILMTVYLFFSFMDKFTSIFSYIFF